MKKFLILICVFIAIMFSSCGYNNENIYSREDMEEAIASAEQRGFDRAYAEAEYCVRAELEQEYREELYYAEAENEHLERISDDAYEAGYERGYYDCLVEHGLYTESEHGTARIEKDK